MRKATLMLATAVFVVAGASMVLAQTDEETDRHDGLLASAVQEVLDELVADDTLTQEQADTVFDALAARKAEIREQAQARRAQIREFWSDGRLTEEEIAQLPDASPWSRLTEALEDGVIERDEVGRLGHLRWVPGPRRP